MEKLKTIASPGCWGNSVELKSADQIPELIDRVLIPDAIKDLSEAFPDEESIVIEIRGKVCSYWCDERGYAYYSDKCPDDHEGRQCCGIAWIYFDGSDPYNDKTPQDSLYDWNGELSPKQAGLYYEIARIRVKLA